MRWLSLGAAAGAAPGLLAACGSQGRAAHGPDAAAAPTAAPSATLSASCPALPRETRGPYPADGGRASGQTLNALTLAGFARSDIRHSVGGASGTASGVPMQLQLNVVNTNAACAPLPGYAVYVWQCTDDGRYSLYTPGLTHENYLRGVQVADAQGRLHFTTIFPGCYPGRWPHIHFEVYASAAAATTEPAGDWMLVSQLALPEDACRAAYASPGYESSLTQLGRLSLQRDGIFRDGYASQMAQVSGSPASGYTAHLTIGLAV